MQELLNQLFSLVCGQSHSHTWFPGGEALPCCQRCTGLYVGAFVATLLYSIWRPAPTLRWLGFNGVLLLFIIPSGFYWIPQNAELRCASGILFGFSLIVFMSLCLFSSGVRKNSWLHLGGFAGILFATIWLTPWLGSTENLFANNLLSAASTFGALALAALLLANLAVLFCWAIKRILQQSELSEV